MGKKTPFSSPWCHTGQVFQISAQFLFQTWRNMKKHYQIWVISEEKDINVLLFRTYFRDRHFTIILWPLCSLGTSTLEHLSTASSCHARDKAKNNIYTDVMATRSQRLWTNAHRRIKKGQRRQKPIWKPFPNNGCPFRQRTLAPATAEQIPLTSTNISQRHADFHISINVLRFNYATQKWPETSNHTSPLPRMFQLKSLFMLRRYSFKNWLLCPVYKITSLKFTECFWQTSSGGGYRPSRSLWRPCWRASVLRWSMSSRAVRSNTEGRRASGVEFFRSKMLEAQLPRGVSSRLTERRFASSCGS